MKLKIPSNAKTIIDTLGGSGFEAYVVGGCVRSALMGIEPHDWDICTNAKPDELKKVFAGFETVDFGLKHGTLAVMAGGELFEVTTYRVDGVYADNRHPESVTFTDDLTLDLSRRDFTCNAIAYSERTGLIDPFGGANDINSKLLRCVGDPDKRFNEDALRIMRGLRFASLCGFSVEETTSRSIHQNAFLLKNIAAERIRVELEGMLTGDNVAEVLNEYRDVLTVFMPELGETFDFPQRTKHHCYDVWRHIVHSVEAVEPDALLRMVMLLHDIGKPRAHTTDESGCDHFKGHPMISAELGEAILKRLRFPNEFVADCLLLVDYHDVRYNGSAKQIKRLLQRLGEKNTMRLFKVQRADTAAQSDYLRREKYAAVDLAEKQAKEIIEANQCFRLKDLAISGNDLIKAGVPEGRSLGELLYRLLDEVIEDRLPNEKQALLDRTKEIYKKTDVLQ